MVWDPLLDWIRDEVGERPSTTSSIFLTNQSDALVAALKAELEKADDWQLAAIDSLSGTARSLTVAFAVARGRVDVIGAKEAIRLEEDFQVGKRVVLDCSYKTCTSSILPGRIVTSGHMVDFTVLLSFQLYRLSFEVAAT